MDFLSVAIQVKAIEPGLLGIVCYAVEGGSHF